MAKWYAAHGSKVLAAARRLQRLEALAQSCPGIVPVALDVSDSAKTAAAIESLDDAHDGIDVVIANAGVGSPTPGDCAHWSEVEAMLRVNVNGAAATLTAILPRMVQRGHGRIAGVSSVARHAGLGAYSGYCGSKAFLSMFLQSLRVDLRGTGVTATCIEPGFVKSEMSDKIEGRAPMPFIAPTETAADVFCRAVERGARTVAFPRVHSVASRALGWLPWFAYEPLARRASEPQRELHALNSRDRRD